MTVDCPYCGARSTCDDSASHCFCSYCGQRIEFVKIPNPDVDSNKTRTRETIDTEARDKEERMRKKRERWRTAVLIGAIIEAIDTIIFTVGESGGIPYIGLIVPFVIAFFYPFQEDWDTVKCVTTWLGRSVLLWLGYSLVSLIIQLPIAFLTGQL